MNVNAEWLSHNRSLKPTGKRKGSIIGHECWSLCLFLYFCLCCCLCISFFFIFFFTLVSFLPWSANIVCLLAFSLSFTFASPLGFCFTFWLDFWLLTHVLCVLLFCFCFCFLLLLLCCLLLTKYTHTQTNKLHTQCTRAFIHTYIHTEWQRHYYHQH